MDQTSGSQEPRVDTSLRLGLPEYHKNHNKTKPQNSPKRVCEACQGGEDTPTWRRGPSGSGTLCNKCGLKYMRQQKKVYNAGPQQ